MGKILILIACLALQWQVTIQQSTDASSGGTTTTDMMTTQTTTEGMMSTTTEMPESTTMEQESTSMMTSMSMMMMSTASGDDVDGGFTEWTDWSECSATCGNHLFQSRTRTCTNPRPSGNGADCDGDLIIVKNCKLDVCQDVLESGATMNVQGDDLTAELFESSEATEAFKEGLSDAINDFCTHNVSQAQLCCGTSDTLGDPTGLKFTNDSLMEVYTQDNDDGIGLTCVQRYDDQNEVCTNVVSKRRRRAIQELDQDVLLTVLNDPDVVDDLEARIAQAIFDATGMTIAITIDDIIRPTPVPTTEMTTTTEKDGLEAWEIALIVVGALIAVAIIIIVIVVCIKKQKNQKVADSGDA